MIKIIIFSLLYIILIINLFYIEITSYFNMYTNIIGYKLNVFKNLNGNFNIRFILNWVLAVAILIFLQYNYIIKENKSLIEGFIFGFLLFAIWNLSILSCSFDKSFPYLLTICYDTIMGGSIILISQYLIYNYYDVLEKNIWLLLLLFIISIFWYFYYSYQYNPDLSNIKGIVLF